MDLTFGLLSLTTIYILYLLFVKGYLWKLILGAFGWFGLYYFLSNQLNLDKITPFKDNFMSWASIIPSVIIILALATTKEE